MKTPDLSTKALDTLQRMFASYPELTEVLLYGSRATGKSRLRSDIDIVTRGLAPHRLGRLTLDLEDTNIPQNFDVQAYESIEYLPLKAHIDSMGISIYKRPREESEGQ